MTPEPSSKPVARLDQFAVGLSLFCFLQCLLTPVLLIAFPTIFGALLSGESFHRILALVIVPVSLVAMFVGCRRHRQWEVLLPAASGLVAIIFAALAGEAVLGEGGEIAFTLSGSGLLALAHVMNFRFCRRNSLACHC